MKQLWLSAALAAALASLASPALAGAFTYHGNLQDAGNAAEGSYDIELTLYSAATGGRVIGGPMTLYAVPVHEGSFSTDVDFGQSIDASVQSYVAVKVRKAGAGDFIALSERAAAVPDVGGGCPGSWSLDGNSGNPAGSYLGTADAQDLLLKAGGITRVQVSASKYALAMSKAAIDSTSGDGSTAVSYADPAKGANSFAGGYSAGTAFDGSFVWGDHPVSAHAIKDTAANQFIVQAGGGVAINGAPKMSSTELSIYPSMSNGNDVSEIFMGQKAFTGGILFSTSNSQGPTTNDAQLTIDQFNGSALNNLMSFTKGGIGLFGSASFGSALAMRPSGIADQVSFEMINGAIASWDFQVDSNGNLHIYTTTPTHPSNSIFDLSSTGDLSVYGSAAKPGGGAWSVFSDRRVKQDIAPIEGAVDTLLKLNPVSFRYTAAYRTATANVPDQTYLGFIAQDYAEVFPEAVSRTNVRVPGAKDDEPRVLTLDPNPALITTVAAVQELARASRDRDAEVVSLRAENAHLRSDLDTLSLRLDALENTKAQ
ncbi:MAG: tail fiber domain-containing protein [Dokdonella sp.]